MNKHLFYLSLFVALWECDQGQTRLKLTLIEQKKSWKKAVNFCSQRNGVLESNTTLAIEQLKNIQSNIKDVWLGKYEAYSQWAYIRGCFLISGNLQNFAKHALDHSEKLECQKLCDEYKFYTVKRLDCYCMHDISSFQRNNICNCTDCFQVWEHQLPEFQTDEKDSVHECIAATCTDKNISRSYRSCEQNFFLICDNNRILNYTSDTHEKASYSCQREGSFIKWYSDDFCISNDATFPFWTSGRRHSLMYHIKKSDDIDPVQLHVCFKLHLSNDSSIIEEITDNCSSHEIHPFLCRFGLNGDEGDNKNVQPDETASIAAGIIVSIIAVIVVILVLLFIHRRRQSKKKPHIHETQNSDCVRDNNKPSQAPVYNEIDGENFIPHKGKLNYSQTVNNITYDHVSSNNTGESLNMYHSVNISSEANDLNSKIGQKELDAIENSSECANSNNYCLAKPISSNTEDESDPYDINRDYDHLHNVKKKEDPITKVYDHLPTSVTEDPTYDHSNLQSASDNEGYYDHFKIDGVNY